jgi:hypothetical protein
LETGGIELLRDSTLVLIGCRESSETIDCPPGSFIVRVD